MSAGAGSGKPGWVDGVSVCGGWREWGGGGKWVGNKSRKYLHTCFYLWPSRPEGTLPRNACTAPSLHWTPPDQLYPELAEKSSKEKQLKQFKQKQTMSALTAVNKQYLNISILSVSHDMELTDKILSKNSPLSYPPTPPPPQHTHTQNNNNHELTGQEML